MNLHVVNISEYVDEMCEIQRVERLLSSNRNFTFTGPYSVIYSYDNTNQMQQAAGGSICLTYACCCMYSSKLLMMDGKTARNMQRVM
jgi:hypothetical protein